MGFDKIGVIGAGTMGNGIAQVCAALHRRAAPGALRARHRDRGLAAGVPFAVGHRARIPRALHRGRRGEPRPDGQIFTTQPDWTLHCASNGTEGITAVVRQHPDVILLDMNLPDMPGTEVFQRLKSDPRTSEIPCVAVSADALPDQVQRVQALGFDDYWTKPLDLPTTIGKLKSLLR